jgi:hypothetical protein
VRIKNCARYKSCALQIVRVTNRARYKSCALKNVALCSYVVKTVIFKEDQLGLSLLTVEQVQSEDFQKRILQSAMA